MVNIIRRMRHLRELLWIRTGPGALLLPKEVTKISMEFSARIEGGHRGARKFWREMLPRIKYRNPAIPIQISRHKNPEGPSLLHIYTSANVQPSATESQTPPSGTPNARNTLTPDTSTPTHTINVKDRQELEILDEFLEKTGATVLHATPEELEELQEIKDYKERAEKDRVEVREKFLAKRREEQMLKMARGEIAAA